MNLIYEYDINKNLILTKKAIVKKTASLSKRFSFHPS